jgi:glycosyltransferase involved in cell wall biosynthesis
LKVSIATAAYEMKGRGALFLGQLCSTLLGQSHKEFELVVSDDSENDEVMNLCKDVSNHLDVRYVRHAGPKKSSANLNNAIENCSGDIVKVLHQDDFLVDQDALARVVSAHESGSMWTLTACVHTNDANSFYRQYVPAFFPGGLYGENLAGSPSLVSFDRGLKSRFDENLIWIMDCEFYHMLFKEFGNPKIIPEVGVAIRIWEGQNTNDISQELRNREESYVRTKHNG